MNMYEGPMDRAKEGVGLRVGSSRGRAEESGGGKMETTIFEHQ